MGSSNTMVYMGSGDTMSTKGTMGTEGGGLYTCHGAMGTMSTMGTVGGG